MVKFLFGVILSVPASCGLADHVRRLDNWILRRQRFPLFIVDSRKNRSSGTHCVVTLFKTKVISRVNVEYHFSEHSNLVEKWNSYNVLYTVENDNVVFDLQI